MKRIVLFALCMFLIMVLCACSAMNRTPDEETILSDYIEKSVETKYTNFNKVEIKRKQFNKTEKTFVADIELIGKDDYADYACSSSIIYNYYDDAGWMLDEINDTKLTTKCYNGRTLDEIETDIKKNYTTYLPGGLWVDDFKAEDLLEQNMQLVTFDCEISTKHLITKYDDLKMYFKYEEGNWQVYNINKTPCNFKINLEGTYWETDEYNNRNITIREISEDSKTIILECNNKEYIGTMTNKYSEDTFFEASPYYKLNTPIPLGSVWGVPQVADNFTIYELTSSDDVWMFFNNSKSYNGGYGAGYDLASLTPTPGSVVYYPN